MARSGFTGISFPFRISKQGGVATSTTSSTNPQHIVESIQQIFNTDYLERVMEPDIYSDLGESLFEPNDEALQGVIKDRIVSTLNNLEDRVEVSEEDITLSSVEENGYSYLYANIKFKIIKYDTWYTETFKVGEI